MENLRLHSHKKVLHIAWYLKIYIILSRLFFYTKANFKQNIKKTNIMKKIIKKCVKRIESSMIEDHSTCIVEDFYKERNKRRLNNDASWKYFTGDTTVFFLLFFLSHK